MIAITGANGKLGYKVIKQLLNIGIPANKIVGVVRSKDKASELIKLGINIREANYNSVDDLKAAFINIDKLLLISSSELGDRVKQHANVILAAKESNIKKLAYTSVLNAAKSTLLLANDHRDTENLIKDSTIPYIFLRNGWYIENFTEQLNSYLEHKVILGSTKNSKISAASRNDLSIAAAKALISDVQNQVYELGGTDFNLTELADTLSQEFKTQIAYKDIPANELEAFYNQIGLPNALSKILADSDEGISRGELFTSSKDLEILINKKPDTIIDVLKSI